MSDTERQRRWRLSSPQAWLKSNLRCARYRAKKAGRECTIMWQEIPLPTVCPVLGLALDYQRLAKIRATPNSPSLDRIDNSLGYVPGNVRVISCRANELKSDATLAEVEAIARYMRGHVS